jgi:hypothetical protein
MFTCEQSGANDATGFELVMMQESTKEQYE